MASRIDDLRIRQDQSDEPDVEEVVGVLVDEEGRLLTVDPVAGKLREALQDLELNQMTPIECMMKLNELKQLLDD